MSTRAATHRFLSNLLRLDGDVELPSVPTPYDEDQHCRRMPVFAEAPQSPQKLEPVVLAGAARFFNVPES